MTTRNVMGILLQVDARSLFGLLTKAEETLWNLEGCENRY